MLLFGELRRGSCDLSPRAMHRTTPKDSGMGIDDGPDNEGPQRIHHDEVMLLVRFISLVFWSTWLCFGF